MADLLALLWTPFLMCLVLTGIHAYLGLHVLAREVVFVDIALAQVAALGTLGAVLAGLPPDSATAYLAGVAATLVGALVLALTRHRERRVSQEAVVGVVYAVSAAAAVLVLARAPQGAEHLRAMLVGSILAVRGRDVLAMGALYAATGVLHWLCRRPFFLISYDPAAAFGAGYRVRAWDFLFYATFGVVVASSVRVAGVLLVFSYLVAPALAATALGGSFARQLLLGWGFGVAASVVGVAASAAFDLPTGAAVVCAFGAALLLLAAARALRRAPAAGRPRVRT